MVILVFSFLIKGRFSKLAWNILKSIFIIFAMSLMVISLIGVIVSLNLAKSYVTNQRFIKISDALVSTSYFSIISLGLFVIYTRNTNKNYKKLLETESLLRNLQKEYYEVLLDKEVETREFRHDISNHILCIGGLVKQGNLAEITEYLNKMENSLIEIQNKSYSTGNEIIDVMLNYNINLLGDSTKVSVTGFCDKKLAMSNMELCSVISNLLQNAVEALTSQQEGRKYLNIHMHTTEKNFSIEIKNSFANKDIVFIKELPSTSKEDKKNHGIGLKNVKRAVQKNKGLLKIEIKEREFFVNVILPVKQFIVPMNI